MPDSRKNNQLGIRKYFLSGSADEAYTAGSLLPHIKSVGTLASCGKIASNSRRSSSTSAQCSMHVRTIPASPAEPCNPPAHPAECVCGRHTFAHANTDTKNPSAQSVARNNPAPKLLPKNGASRRPCAEYGFTGATSTSLRKRSRHSHPNIPQPPSSQPRRHAKSPADQTTKLPAAQ